MTCFSRSLFVLATLAVGGAAPLSAQIVSDGSFEATQLGDGFYYNPSGFSFSFTSTAGVINAPSAFNGPQTGFSGNQYSLLQTNVNDGRSDGNGGKITQTITLPSDGVYKFSDINARRGTENASYVVQLDGVTISPNLLTKASSFNPSSFTFSSTAGAHTLVLLSTGPTDSTMFVDDVAIEAFTGGFTTRAFLGDADSGIAPGAFTHAVNLGGGSVTVNGVNFAAGATAPNFSLTGATTNFTNNAPGTGNNTLTGNVATLVQDFLYGSDNNQVRLTLQGLTVGQTYLTSFYSHSYGSPGGRFVTITDPRGRSLLYDENGTGGGSILQDTFVASASSQDFTFVASSAPDTFHFYGFTNQAIPEPGIAGLLTLGLSALALRRRQSRNLS